jgi:hypothetical protein
MRATSMRRLVGGAAALMLVGTMLLTTTGSALAATTRLLYVGSDPGFSLNNGVITFTPVSSGGMSLSAVYVKNIDNQNLTHVVITFVRAQNGASISSQILGANASSCSATDTLITCDFGNIKARSTRSFQLILSAPAAGTLAIHGTVVFDESNNPNGGNEQINSVDGSLVVDQATCHTLATFLPPGVAKTLVPDDGTGCVNPAQKSGLVVPAAANGSIVQLDDSQAATNCPSGFTCLGDAVSATVNNGAPVSPYLKWTIFYSNATLGNVNPNKVAFVHGTTIIAAGNKGQCKNATSTNCQEPYVVSADGVTFFVRTPTNGLIKGMN